MPDDPAADRQAQARALRLAGERTAITHMFIELGAKGIEVFDDIPLKGERTIAMYALETLKKHGSKEDIASAYDALGQEITMKKPANAALAKNLQAIQNE